MGLEEARQNIEQSVQASGAGTQDTESSGDGAQASSNESAGLAPDSASSASEPLDLSTIDKFKWDGKEMTTEELKRSILRQEDYTRKTQEAAAIRREALEMKRQNELAKQEFEKAQTQHQQFIDNIDIDIENVLKDPSLATKFKEIYPKQFHARLDKILNEKFGSPDPNNPKETIYDQRLRAVEERFQRAEQEKAAAAFESDVRFNSQSLDSIVDKLSAKYPNADEDSVLAKAEYMSAQIAKDSKFQDNFSKLMETLYKQNHDHHEKRYQEIYKQKVETQKQKNFQGRDAGRGGATPATAPTKMKLSDVKHHIAKSMGGS